MKNKKKAGKLIYKRQYKVFSWLLCLISFAVFCVTLILTIYARDVYGTYIFNGLYDEYQQTPRYVQDLTDEMQSILSNCQTLIESDSKKDTITILDMTSKTLYYYSRDLIGEALYNGDFHAEKMEDLRQYEAGSSIEAERFHPLEAYDYLVRFLKNEKFDIDYIYYDSDKLVDLFKENGIQNVAHRFSEEFSESAYFVFETNTLEDSNNPFELDPEQYETILWKAEGDGVVRKETIIAPYNLAAYVVYDPKENLFYSKKDDNYLVTNHFLYDVDEAIKHIKEREKKKWYSNLVIAFLQNHNFSFEDFAKRTFENYGEVDAIRNELNSNIERGVYYYLSSKGSQNYTNAGSFHMITQLPHYCIEINNQGEIVQSATGGLETIENYHLDFVKEMCSPGDKFYIAFDMQHSLGTENLVSDVIYRENEFKYLNQYSVMIFAGTVVSFLLCLVLVITLFIGNGKAYKEDTHIKLNWYDRLFSEWWILISGIIIVLCVVQGMDLFLVEIEPNKMIYTLVVIGVGSFIIGSLILWISLSTAKRIKDRSVWNNWLFARVYTRVNRISNQEPVEKEEAVVTVLANVALWFGKKYYNIRGTKKIILLFALFIFLEVVILINVILGSITTSIGFLIFLILQMIALLCVAHLIRDIKKLATGIEEINKGDFENKVTVNAKTSVLGELALGVNQIGDGLKHAVETSLKDERMKTELITNVSHDLKTPLTSIINYIDLLKKENIPGEDAQHYIEVLDKKAQRLKHLTEDLVEAAKATSGNIELEMMPLAFNELMKQALGEFEDKFEKRKLSLVAKYPDETLVVMADGRRLFRIIENVLQNAYKYSMENTRIYAQLYQENAEAVFSLKNVSAAPLNISPEELMERFTRGDTARSTEGSGLGLSIAKDLTKLQDGEFDIQLDGDLFKVLIRFPLCKQQQNTV